MILLVFLNKYDKNSYMLGKSLPEYLVGDYVKLYAREKDEKYDLCEIHNTLPKIKEYAQVFDKVLVSFGLRMFPPSAYKELITENKNITQSVVFLKKLKGSKTWTISNNKLSFDNSRISDTGLFILQAKDILECKTNNFNDMLQELISKDKLVYKFVPYWVLTNNINKNKIIRKKEIR